MKDDNDHITSGIFLNDGGFLPVDYPDLIALVEAGLLKITGLDEQGRPNRFIITQDGFDYAKELEDEDRPNIPPTQ